MDAPSPTRPATPADLATIVALERRVFPDPWSEAHVRSALDGLAFVAEGAEGAPIGYVMGVAAADEGELLNLAVDPRCRRRGVGRALLRRMLASMAQRGVERVYLEVRESNAGARAFYAAHGFHEVARRVRYYRRPQEDALVLARAVRVD